MRFAIDVTACWRPQRVGMLTVAVELSRALVEQRGDDEIVLLCSRDRPDALQNLPCEAVLSPYRHEVMLKTRWLPAIEPMLGCDAILYPYWPSPPVRRAAAPPVVVFVHDLAFRLRPKEVPWQQRLYFGVLLPRALGTAAAVLVPSESTRRDLLGLYRTRGLEGKTEIVPEGLPAAIPGGALPDGLEPGFVLAVGTVEPRKNYPRLLAAYASLRAKKAVPPLVVAGRAGWAFGDTLSRLSTEPGVRYLGHVDEPTLAALYQAAGVLAFPSLYEGFGLPLLEAMSNGVPAVVGAAGSLPELGAGAVLAVEATDEVAIARALDSLLSDPDLRSRLGQEGRRRAAEFTWSRAAGQTLEVLRRVGEPARRKVA